MYMQESEGIAKTSNFEAFTTEQKNEHICDAFINGIISICISQQLLESSTSSLEEDYDQARTLEKAQNKSASYDSGSVARIAK